MQMKRRDFLKAVGAGLCLTAGGYGSNAAANASRKPNIILVMADDQGWGDVGYYRHPFVKTPNLDEMAAVSLRFDRFYAGAPVCSPTRANVLTGRNPNRCNVLNHGRSYRPQEITIAEALKTAGYATGHFGKWHVGSVQKTSPVNPSNSGFDEWLSRPNYFDLDPLLSRNGVAVQCKGESSMITVDAAIEFIRTNAQASKPFLALVWFGSPHDPHRALPEDSDLYQGRQSQGYYAEITAMDRAFGKLRRELRALDIQDNTILWYCSDNGGLVDASSGGRAKKASIYEGGLRVPGIVEWPARIRRPSICNIPSGTMDIYPTLLDIVGVKMENQPPLDGISLVDVFDGKMTKRPKPIGFWFNLGTGRLTYSDRILRALMEAQKKGEEVGDRERLDLDAGEITQQYPEDSFPGHAAWLDWPWKLHRIQRPFAGARAGAGEPSLVLELYNLAQDPNEEKDLADEQPERVKSMRSQLEQWQVSVIRSLNGKDYPATTSP